MRENARISEDPYSGGSRISRRGGADLVGGGAPTAEAAMFWKICMSKQKNLDP